jgi:hypothetical protein
MKNRFSNVRKRQHVPNEIETAVLARSKRRCALCFFLDGDEQEKRGQIAHVDRDPSNNDGDNLVWLCLEHHDQYDTRPSQSKGFTRSELIHARNELYRSFGTTEQNAADTVRQAESVRRLEDHVASIRYSVSTLMETLLASPQSPGTSAWLDRRLTPHLPGKPSKVGSLGDAADFEQRSKILLRKLREDERMAPILNGIHLPIHLPQCEIGDYGGLVDDLFLPAVKRAYEATFSNRRFQDNVKGNLSGRLAVARECRQEKLIEVMATGPIVGILFPIALQGYSILAAREQMASLPEGFILSGVLDTCVAMITYPDVLATDHAPTLVCAGTTWATDLSLCFHPGEKSLSFCVADEAVAVGSFSPCLLYIDR